MDNFDFIINQYLNDPENPEFNYELGSFYYSIGQTAAALSYYLRAAERTSDKLLAYECLLYIGLCFDKQGNRKFSATGAYKHAICLLPNRQEAYYLISNLNRRHDQYVDAYIYAELGLKANNLSDFNYIKTDVPFNGARSFIFELMISSWWWGKHVECKNHLTFLVDNHWSELNDSEKSTIREYYKKYDPLSFNRKISKMINSDNTFAFNPNSRNRVWVVDDFYANPIAIREFALKQEYIEGGFGRGYIGRRTSKQFLFDGLKEQFEDVMGRKITRWQEYDMNGRFQIAWAGEALVYHCDLQKWAGMIYLTPEAPFETGTTLYAHKKTRVRDYHDPNWKQVWPTDEKTHLDRTPFQPVDVLGNVFNRLVIFDASSIHSASEYFGQDRTDGRLWQMFFFD